jgi:hypothetical protein
MADYSLSRAGQALHIPAEDKAIVEGIGAGMAITALIKADLWLTVAGGVILFLGATA